MKQGARPNRRVIVCDDTCKTGSGGTSLTLRALSEVFNGYEFAFIHTDQLNSQSFDETDPQDVWILGNTLNAQYEQLQILSKILLCRKCFCIEFDFGFCQYRSEAGFKHFTGRGVWGPFSEEGSKIHKNLYDLRRRNAAATFYMSEKQRQIHNQHLDFAPVPPEKQFILGSVFSVESLSLMVRLRLNSPEKNGKYAIVDGNGGWHSIAKGVRQATLFAKKTQKPFEVIGQDNYELFLNTLNQFSGLIFLPIIHDTCPRLTIEAKILGLELILNKNCLHAEEEWFSLEGEDLANHLLDRPYFFKSIIEGEI